MKPPRHVGLTPEEKGMKKVREQDVWIWERRLERYRAHGAGQSTTDRTIIRMVSKLRPREERSSKIGDPSQFHSRRWLVGGEAGDVVGPGVLSGTGLPFDQKRRRSISCCQAELEWKAAGTLARWIASDENPLTARSIVNRSLAISLRSRNRSHRQITSEEKGSQADTFRSCSTG